MKPDSYYEAHAYTDASDQIWKEHASWRTEALAQLKERRLTVAEREEAQATIHAEFKQRITDALRPIEEIREQRRQEFWVDAAKELGFDPEHADTLRRSSEFLLERFHPQLTGKLTFQNVRDMLTVCRHLAKHCTGPIGSFPDLQAFHDRNYSDDVD